MKNGEGTLEEPRRNAARREEGKPEGKPQGRPEGGREKAARPDRGSALSSARGSRPEREETRPNGDAELATATVDRVLDLLTGHPEINEYKHTSVPM
jgi:hypothetical protein